MKRIVGWAIICVLIVLGHAHAQPGFWDNDRVLFGFDGHERHPAITSTPSGLHAWCRLEADSILHAVSTNSGLTWPSDELPAISTAPDDILLCSAADGLRSFLLLFDEGAHALALFSYIPIGNDIQREMLTVREFSGDTICTALAATTDYLFAPDDPYINLVWQEQTSSTNLVRSAQSRDHGQSLEAIQTISNLPPMSPRAKNVAAAVTWQNETERVWVAETREREASAAEQIVLTPAEGGEPAIVDWSGYPQLQVSIAGFEQLLIVAYTRRVNSAAQKEVFFCYSPDGGSTFSEPEPLTNSELDENFPKVAIFPEENRFAIFYLSGDYQQDEATLWVRQGDMNSPWQPQPATQISATDGVSLSGGFDASATFEGFAAAWSGPGLGGDLDIWFDAARITSAIGNPTRVLPNAISLGDPYPNPFNAVTTIPLRVQRGGNYTLEIHDLLGRGIAEINTANLAPGDHHLTIDFSDFSSGTYFIHDPGGAANAKVVLLK